jgi:hypothetical protein
LTVTPQPEAFMMIASTGAATAPAGSMCGHQASILARISALPPSWSLR